MRGIQKNPSDPYDYYRLDINNQYFFTKEDETPDIHLVINSFYSLNFGDNEAVLKWLCDLSSVSFNINNPSNRSTIISIFQDHGFPVNANMGNDYNENDADNHAKYIIGQALGNIETHGDVHSIIFTHVERWQKKFKKGKESESFTERVREKARQTALDVIDFFFGF